MSALVSLQDKNTNKWHNKLKHLLGFESIVHARKHLLINSDKNSLYCHRSSLLPGDADQNAGFENSIVVAIERLMCSHCDRKTPRLPVSIMPRLWGNLRFAVHGKNAGSVVTNQCVFRLHFLSPIFHTMIPYPDSKEIRSWVHWKKWSKRRLKGNVRQ